MERSEAVWALMADRGQLREARYQAPSIWNDERPSTSFSLS